MTRMIGLCVVGFLALALSSAVAEDLPDSFVVKSPANLQWQADPRLPGFSVHFLHSNPEEAGFYLLRYKFAPGVKTPPQSEWMRPKASSSLRTAALTVCFANPGTSEMQLVAALDSRGVERPVAAARPGPTRPSFSQPMDGRAGYVRKFVDR